MIIALYIRKYCIFGQKYDISTIIIKVSNKKDLYAYIGYLYQTSIEKIDRIDWYRVESTQEIVIDVSDFMSNMEVPL